MVVSEIKVEKGVKERIRLAAYCRVSSDSTDQLNSFMAQIRYYTDYTKLHPEYDLVDIYADATVIIGLKQNPTYGRRFSPIFLFIRAFCGAKRKMLLLIKEENRIRYGLRRSLSIETMNALAYIRRTEVSMNETIKNIPLDELHPFPNHPFGVRDDEVMEQTTKSIQEYGVLVPAIARPREEGGYELIAGHRRKHACELAGLQTMPVIVRDLDRNTATIIMVDSNIQRENILPSEKAKAYKMKMEAIKRSAGRPTKENSCHNGTDFRGVRSDEVVAENSSDSVRTIQRYIRLNELEPQLMQMVDEETIIKLLENWMKKRQRDQQR